MGPEGTWDGGNAGLTVEHVGFARVVSEMRGGERTFAALI